MSVRADAETLRLIPLFHRCDPVPLQIMAFAAPRKSFTAGETLLKEGEKANSAYLIMSGSVELQRAGKTVGTAEEGSFLGETAMIGAIPYSLTAFASGDVSTAQIDRDLFMRVAQEYPEFGRTVLQALSHKLDHSVRDFDQIRAKLNKMKSFSEL